MSRKKKDDDITQIIVLSVFALILMIVAIVLTIMVIKSDFPLWLKILLIG